MSLAVMIPHHHPHKRVNRTVPATRLGSSPVQLIHLTAAVLLICTLLGTLCAAEPAEILPAPAPAPAPLPAVPPVTAEGGGPAEVGQILLPENFDQHFLVFQSAKQIGIQRDRSQIQLVKGSRFVAESIELERAFSAGGGAFHVKTVRRWVREENGFPTAYSLVVEDGSSRMTVDAEWDAARKQFNYRSAAAEGRLQGAVAIPKPAETVANLDGVILYRAGQLKEGGDLTRYILMLYPPNFGLGRERARVVKKEAGPDGHGIVYTLEIADASQPDGSPAPNAEPPRILMVNELGQPLQKIVYPNRWLAVRPDLAVMPPKPPVFANSLKPVAADPKHPVPVRSTEVDRLERSFLILSAPTLTALAPGAGQDVALTRDQDRTVAVVKLRAVRLDGRAVMETLTVDARNAALAATSKIQSDHRDIQTRAASIELAVLERHAAAQSKAGLPSTPLPAAERDYRVAQAIVTWVFHRLKKDSAGPANASALHALYYLRGDCTEHANLVVALARAARIPARICRGMVLEGGEFCAHQWAEIFLAGYGGLPLEAAPLQPGETQGLWLPVDPTLGRWGIPAAYLFLGHDEPGLDATLNNLMFDGDATWMTGAGPDLAAPVAPAAATSLENPAP